MKEGHMANGRGDIMRALLCFREAYLLGGRMEARVSAANMSLKLGLLEEAFAEYDQMLIGPARLPEPVARIVRRKHREALATMRAQNATPTRLSEPGEVRITLGDTHGLPAGPLVVSVAVNGREQTRPPATTLAGEEFRFVGTLDDMVPGGALLRISSAGRGALDRGAVVAEAHVVLESLRISKREATWDEPLNPGGSCQLTVFWEPLPDRLRGHGVLTVHLQRAFGLTPADWNGKSDPYAELCLDGKLQTSKVVYNTLSPEWDESFAFEGMLHRLTTEKLEVEVKDYDVVGSHKPLAQGRVVLNQLRKQDASQLEVALVGLCKGKSGAVPTLVLAASWRQTRPAVFIEEGKTEASRVDAAAEADRMVASIREHPLSSDDLRKIQEDWQGDSLLDLCCGLRNSKANHWTRRVCGA